MHSALYITNTYLTYSILYMISCLNISYSQEIGESVLFHQVLKAYPSHHLWIITAHVSLGNLEHHWKSFNRQMDTACQLLQILSLQPSSPTQLTTALQVELSNIEDIYNSYKPTIISAINMMNADPSFDGHSNRNSDVKRSLLLFLGDTLSWLTGTATTKDVNSIKKHVNQLIEAQSVQQDTLVHVVSILMA